MGPARNFALAAVLASNVAQADTASAEMTFGPKHCVSVSRNEKTGTCILRTDCQNIKLDEVEFAFTCRKPGVIQKHSFGKGGFDPVEEFDTSVKCDVCGLPSEVAMSLKRAQFLGSSTTGTEAVKVSEVAKKSSNQAETVSIKEVSQKEEKASHDQDEVAKQTSTVGSAVGSTVDNKVSYGPQNCVTTWLQADASATVGSGAKTDGEAGVCIVKTDCGNIPAATFENYPVGVIAVNKDNVPVRHLFGKNSFNPAEEFNTLIRATACVGLDQTAEAITLDNEVKALSRIVSDLKGKVDKLEGGAAAATKLIRRDHQLLVSNTEAAEKERLEEERERREEDREQRERDEQASREEDEQEGGSAVQLDDESNNDNDDAGRDLPPEFRNEHEGRMFHEEADSERE